MIIYLIALEDYPRFFSTRGGLLGVLRTIASLILCFTFMIVLFLFFSLFFFSFVESSLSFFWTLFSRGVDSKCNADDSEKTWGKLDRTWV